MLTRDPYYSYICNLAFKRDKDRYTKLLSTLHSYPFEYILDLDENREADALDMRLDYMKNNIYFKYDLEVLYHERPASVLEVMVALSKRCYDTVLDPGDGMDRTNELFWLMLSNMGLSNCTDDNFDYGLVNTAVMRVMNRDYAADGKGGWFYIPGVNEDLRKVELWYQAMWYIDDIYN